MSTAEISTTTKTAAAAHQIQIAFRAHRLDRLAAAVKGPLGHCDENHA